MGSPYLVPTRVRRLLADALLAQADNYLDMKLGVAELAAAQDGDKVGAGVADQARQVHAQILALATRLRSTADPIESTYTPETWQRLVDDHSNEDVVGACVASYLTWAADSIGEVAGDALDAAAERLILDLERSYERYRGRAQ